MGVRLVVYDLQSQLNEAKYTGTHNHDEMIHRDWADQHPIYAITGLQEVLNTIEDNITYILELLDRKEKEIKLYSVNYTDNEILKVNDRIDNLNIIKDVIDTDTIDLTYDDTNKTLKADTRIYQDPDKKNALISTKDGLFVPQLETEDTKTITWDTLFYGERLKDIYDFGLRFSHNNTSQYIKIVSADEANSWTWDDDKQTITSPLNTNTYIGILSKDYYDYYKHTVRLSSTADDNDIIGAVVAEYEDWQDNPHTLSLLIQPGGNTYLNFRAALVYNYRLPNQAIIQSYNLNDSNKNWDQYTNGITLYITKQNNIITASITAFDYENNIDTINAADTIPFEYTFNIDLNNYSWGSYFLGKVRYGYSACSQPDCCFDHIYFYGGDVRSSNKVSSSVKLDTSEQNAIKVTEEGLFTQRFNISNQAHNALQKFEDGYYVATSTLALSEQEDNGLIEDSPDHYYVRKSTNYLNVNQEDHNLIVGDFIYFSPETFKYQKALAIDDLHINIVGMVSKIIDKDNFEYVCDGFVKTDMFDEKHDFAQGMPVYISDKEAGKVVQEQPNISKTVGYPINNQGIIVRIERGIQYNQEASIGDFKTSANDYNIRSDGFIKIADNIDYKLSLTQRLTNSLSEDFRSKYIEINESEMIMRFKNIDKLYYQENVPEGLNLFIKAF